MPAETRAILEACPGFVFPRCLEELATLAAQGASGGLAEVAYDVPGRGKVVEALVCHARNGIAVTFPDAAMRRGETSGLVIADERPTDKPTFREAFGEEFGPLRQATFDWLATQPLIVLSFVTGPPDSGVPCIALIPQNAGFFAFALALMQGLAPESVAPRAVLYVAPPFRHTRFGGQQVEVHQRGETLHELFSYHIHPGTGARSGVYGLLLALGVEQGWSPLHGATVQVVTPYDNRVVFAHEGAVGSGKSEMLAPIQRESDGTIILGRNTCDGELRILTLPRACELRPVADECALAYPALDKGRGKLTVVDGEQAWFVRVDRIDRYGVEPVLESIAVHSPEPLVFLNIDARPGATALPWEHSEEAPGVRCADPRIVIPRRIVPDIVRAPVDVDVRTFGMRCPPCTRERPTYGILGFFHLLPPALAWLWRLVAPRGHRSADVEPSADGVGSFWSFATGRLVDHANLLLNQIIETPNVRYALVPNQHVGAWEVGFMPQWIAREYLARRGARFSFRQVHPARCALLGLTPNQVLVEGRHVPPFLFDVERQPEVGEEGFDRGASALVGLFERELPRYLQDDLLALGRQIIECCLDGGSHEDYAGFIGHETFEGED